MWSERCTTRGFYVHVCMVAVLQGLLILMVNRPSTVVVPHVLSSVGHC